MEQAKTLLAEVRLHAGNLFGERALFEERATCRLGDGRHGGQANQLLHCLHSSSHHIIHNYIYVLYIKYYILYIISYIYVAYSICQVPFCFPLSLLLEALLCPILSSQEGRESFRWRKRCHGGAQGFAEPSIGNSPRSGQDMNRFEYIYICLI